MKNFLKNLDHQMKAKAMAVYDIEVPQRYWSHFVRVSGASEQLYIIKQLIKPLELQNRPLNCLIVGVAGGRDYWGLKAWGHHVQGLDLGVIPDCPDVQYGNAESQWPFENQIFDVVIMGEILEHLNQDMAALAQARRVLKPAGVLIATVPFLSSQANYHLRLHDPRSIKKLLQANGFAIQDYLERPGFLFNLRICNFINFLIAAPLFLLTKKNIYGIIAKCYGELEWTLGHRRYYPRFLFRCLRLINWGATIKCQISAESLDYTGINKSVFTQGPIPSKMI